MRTNKLRPEPLHWVRDLCVTARFSASNIGLSSARLIYFVFDLGRYSSVLVMVGSCFVLYSPYMGPGRINIRNARIMRRA